MRNCSFNRAKKRKNAKTKKAGKIRRENSKWIRHKQRDHFFKKIADFVAFTLLQSLQRFWKLKKSILYRS